MNRRDLLRLGAFGVAGATLQSALARPLYAASPALGQKKMLLIFLRGGNDSANTVVPQSWDPFAGQYVGDLTYSSTCRSSIFLESDPTSTATPTLDLGNNFASLHPALQALMPVVTAGNLVFLHRVGMDDRTGSHFTDQQGWETGNPGVLADEEGWVTRLTPHVAAAGSPLPAVSISGRQQRLFLSTDPTLTLPVIRRIHQNDNVTLHYTLEDGITNPTRQAIDDKLRGSATAYGGLGHGLRGHHQNAGPGSGLGPLIRATGTSTLDSEAVIAGLPSPYSPGGGAVYPTTNLGSYGLPNENWVVSFMRSLEDAMQLLKQTDCAVAGVEIGGWDTHNNQGGATGTHADHLATIAFGLYNVWLDTVGDDSFTDKLLSLVMSEFGRTSADNGTSGTDHGDAGVMFAMGDMVQLNGGTPVYNCDASTWAQGDMFSSGTNPPPCHPSAGRYVEHKTEFRAVFLEVFQRYYGLSPIAASAILRGWVPSASNPKHFPIGFL